MPSEFGPVRRLVERAAKTAPALHNAAIYMLRHEDFHGDYGRHIAEMTAIRAEADELDARSAWPTGSQAAEQLARAVTAARQFDRQMWGYPVRAWESYSPESQAEFIAQAAAVLRVLAGAQEDSDV